MLHKVEKTHTHTKYCRRMPFIASTVGFSTPNLLNDFFAATADTFLFQDSDANGLREAIVAKGGTKMRKDTLSVNGLVLKVITYFLGCFFWSALMKKKHLRKKKNKRVVLGPHSTTLLEECCYFNSSQG